MDKLNLRFREKRAFGLKSGGSVVVKYDDGDTMGEPIYSVRLIACSWADVVAIGRALAPDGLSVMEHEEAVREVDVAEPEEDAP